MGERDHVVTDIGRPVRDQGREVAPVVRERKGEYRQELAQFRARGFVRARIDGEVRRLDEDISLHRYKYHTIELVVDRLRVDADKSSRLAEAVEQALGLAGGLLAVLRGDDYELCFTCDKVPPELGSEAVRIGQIVGGSGVFVDGKQLDVAGYSHFAREGVGGLPEYQYSGKLQYTLG